MKRIARYINRHIAPHHETGEKALALRHEALLFYALFLFLLQFGLHLVSVRFPGILGFASNITIEGIINDTNKERTARGLRPLRLDNRLSRAASEKGSYMLTKNYWAHNAPDGTTPWFFIQKTKYHYLYAGENLAKDFQNSKDVVEAWMGSKTGHRENILNVNYSDIGVAVTNGVLDGFETTLVVQMFGSEKPTAAEVAAAPASPEQETAVPQKNTETKEEAELKPVAVSLEGPTLEGEKKFVSSGVSPAVIQPSYTAISNPLIPLVDVVALGKSVSYTFGFFLLGLFILDSLVIARKRFVRISGHSAAHIMVVVLLLATTWLMSPGTIR